MHRALLMCVTLTVVLPAINKPSLADTHDPPLSGIVSFESFNKLGYYIRHIDSRAIISQYSTPESSVLDRTPLEKFDATFIVSPGLSGQFECPPPPPPPARPVPCSVSFESVNFPGKYLRHKNSEVVLEKNDNSDRFRKDASFIWHNRKTFTGGENVVNLEAVEPRGHYIRHQDFKLRIALRGTLPTFDVDATFFPRPGLRPRRDMGVETVSFRSVNLADKFIRHAHSLGEVTKVASMLDRADATFMVRPGLKEQRNSVSYESVNYPGYYLRHKDFRIRIDRNDGTDLFKSDATFFRRAPLAGGPPNAVSLESVSPKLARHYIRHQDSHLWLAPPWVGDPQTFNRDATFEALEGFVTEPLPCGIRRVGPAVPDPLGPPTVLSTTRLGQLTGTVDPEGLPLLSHPDHWRNSGVDGVDMGANTSHNDVWHIFFGDVVGAQADGDLVARQLPSLDTLQLMPIRISQNGPYNPYQTAGPGHPSYDLGRNRTPTGAFSYVVSNTPRVFVFAFVGDRFNPDWPVSSVLSSKADPSQTDPLTYKTEFKFSHEKFWMVSPTVVRNSEHPGLPSSVGDGLVILGGGEKDSVHLAWMELDPVKWGPKLSTVRYFTGTPGTASWSEPTGMSEDDARANPAQAFQHEKKAKRVASLPPYFSTVSASWLPAARRWLLMTSGGVFEQPNPHRQLPQRPIVVQFGTKPWFWSRRLDVFDPCREQAYGRYMHWTGLDDIHIRVPPKLHLDDGRDTWALERGHAYGGFIVDRFTKYEPLNKNVNLVYLMSTFNPYQVHVMRTVLRLPGQ